MPKITAYLQPIAATGLALFVGFFQHTSLAQTFTEPTPDALYADTSEDKFLEPTVALPAPPNSKDLVEVVLPKQGVRFFIDPKSIWLDRDKFLVRYTLVTESQGGTQQIQYQGLRCDAKSYRNYAFLQTKNTPPDWRENTQINWILINPNVSYNRIHAELAFNRLICEGKYTNRDAKSIIDAIKNPPTRQFKSPY
jgi:CNP1-like family